jgi:hypothetical protein
MARSSGVVRSSYTGSLALLHPPKKTGEDFAGFSYLRLGVIPIFPACVQLLSAHV